MISPRVENPDESMAQLVVRQLVVRQLEEGVKTRLKRRAARHGRSLEEEVREILRSAVAVEQSSEASLGSRIAARFAERGIARDPPELRGERPRVPRFGR